MMRRAVFFSSCSLTILLVAAAVEPPSVTETLHILFDEFDEWSITDHPKWNDPLGDYSIMDSGDDVSLDAIKEHQGDIREFCERLHALDASLLSEDDRINYRILEEILVVAIARFEFREYLVPITGLYGAHQCVPDYSYGFTFQYPKDYVRYMEGLEKVPDQFQDIQARMRLAIVEDCMPPLDAVRNTLEEIDDVLETGLWQLSWPFGSHPEGIGKMQQEALYARFLNLTYPAMVGALTDFSTFVEEEFLPKCRTSIGASQGPGGLASYEDALRRYSTLSISADEVHSIGLSEVARLRVRMIEHIRQTELLAHSGLDASTDDDALLAEFFEYLRNKSSHFYTDGRELLAGYRSICKDIDGRLPLLFSHFPRMPYGVDAIPAHLAQSQPALYYVSGNLEQRRSASLMVNVQHLEFHPTFSMTALALHEGMPGHHMQAALGSELERLPRFRQRPYLLGYDEGWALYAETLGYELGLYDDPYAAFGQMYQEMERACRLVVDSGIHAHSWTREQSIAYLLSNIPITKRDAEHEVDRYITWPAQGTAYKLGELKIRELRTRAEEALDRRFDVREFHNVVLGAGSMTLPMLEARVDRWIAETGQ